LTIIKVLPTTVTLKKRKHNMKRGIYNEEGELVEEVYDYWEDQGGYYTCGDPYCAGNCGRCS
tara:strand:+ start:194 stop:379 length:186 start_codon:yes stop_codon:yes gene_type:complete